VRPHGLTSRIGRKETGSFRRAEKKIRTFVEQALEIGKPTLEDLEALDKSRKWTFVKVADGSE